MKIQLFAFSSSLLFLISSCAEKKYKRTIKLPDHKFYIEVFTANSWGLNQEYFTDSLNFRMYVGTVDEEHDFYKYKIQDDSLYITKILTGNKNCRLEITKDGLQNFLCDTEFVARKPISILKLKTTKRFD